MTDATTFFLAIWGAVLGTIGTLVSVILAVREFRKDRHQVKISADVSKNDPFWLVSGMETKTYVVISVLNAGFRPIQIKTVLLSLSDGKTIDNGRLSQNELPQILEESQSLDVYFELSELRKAIASRKVFLKAGYAFDAVGNKWKCNIPKTIRQMI
jgi:hypothetical protein